MYNNNLPIYQFANLHTTHMNKTRRTTTTTNRHFSPEVLKYSTPKIAQQRAYKYLGKSAVLYPSTRKHKKYMIQNANTPTGRWVHFGQLGYEDFTKHHDTHRRKNYLTRASNIRGDWKRDPYSANNLAIHVLW